MTAAWLTRLWYPADDDPGGSGGRLASLFLVPLSWVYALVVATRRGLYRIGLLPSRGMPVPVWIVGNVTVGGTGKTPLVIWLIEYLRRNGLTPGVVSRGYGARPGPHPLIVSAETPAERCGDEPRLICLRTGAPVVVHPDRVGACEALLSQYPEVDIILSDDGLQHLRLRRDREIAVLDGARGLGNRRLLPAGPLREPASRLAEVDLLVVQGTDAAGVPGGQRMEAVPRALVQLADARRMDPGGLAGRGVRAVAGIADPERFFRTLEALGAEVERCPLPDHAAVPDSLLAETDDRRMVVMTEKDGARLPRRPRAGVWALQMDMRFPEAGRAAIERTLAVWIAEDRRPKTETEADA